MFLAAPCFPPTPRACQVHLPVLCFVWRWLLCRRRPVAVCGMAQNCAQRRRQASPAPRVTIAFLGGVTFASSELVLPLQKRFPSGASLTSSISIHMSVTSLRASGNALCSCKLLLPSPRRRECGSDAYATKASLLAAPSMSWNSVSRLTWQHAARMALVRSTLPLVTRPDFSKVDGKPLPTRLLSGVNASSSTRALARMISNLSPPMQCYGRWASVSWIPPGQNCRGLQAKLSSWDKRQGRRGKGALSRITPLQRTQWYRDLCAESIEPNRGPSGSCLGFKPLTLVSLMCKDDTTHMRLPRLTCNNRCASLCFKRCASLLTRCVPNTSQHCGLHLLHWAGSLPSCSSRL